MKWLQRLACLLMMMSVALPSVASARRGQSSKMASRGGRGCGDASSGDRVTQELKPLMKQLTFTRYTGFELLQTFPAQLSVGGTASFSLVGERRLKLELLSKDEKRAKLRVRLFNGKEKVLDTTVSVNRNRSFIIGGPRYKGGAIVLPLTVRY